MKKNILLLLFAILLSTLSAQEYWHPIESNTDHDLHCIDFLTDDLGYIGGVEVLLKTTDGGGSWSEVVIDSINTWAAPPYTFNGIHFFTEEYGLAVFGDYGSLAETLDGGTSWTSVPTANSGLCYFGALYFFNEDNGFVGGHGCFSGSIIDRYNGGEWSTTTMPPTFADLSSMIRAFDFVDMVNGIAVADKIYRTTDGGQVWDSIPLSTDINNGFSFSLTDVTYRTVDSVYVTYSSENGFGVLLSTDGGLTWDIDWETATFFYPDMYAVHFDGNGVGFIAGEYDFEDTLGIVYNENPNFWNSVTLDEPIRDITSHSDSITFLVGLNGAIYVNVEPGTLELADVETARSFSFYPNPASSYVDLQLMDPTDRIMEIRLLDISGKLMPVELDVDRFRARVELVDLPISTYLIEVHSEKGSSVQELIRK